jgi:hypothetical protein
MPTSSHVLPWIDRALKAKRRPSCETIVADGRNRQPRPMSWAALAREISNMAGHDVSGETLRLHFGHLDAAPECVES